MTQTSFLTLAAGATAALMALAQPAHAQTITGLKAEPAQAEVGQPVKATTSFDVTNNQINCRVRVHFGDGASEDFKVNQEKDVPLVLEHRYAKPGTYELMVEGKSGTRCTGQPAKATVQVVAKASARAGAHAGTAAAAGAAGAACPDGWKLAKPGVSKKTGAYACTAKAGTAVPEPKITCPGELTYFENTKKGRLGCQP